MGIGFVVFDWYEVWISSYVSKSDESTSNYSSESMHLKFWICIPEYDNLGPRLSKILNFE